MAMLVGKATLEKLGARMNEAAAAGPSSFARRQLERMGWTEGRGLGKNEDGVATHVRAKKRDENAGLGTEKQAIEATVGGDWWNDAFASALTSVGGSRRKKKLKRGREGANTAPTFEELFEATGGARLGMRARARQDGKLARADSAVPAAKRARALALAEGKEPAEAQDEGGEIAGSNAAKHGKEKKRKFKAKGAGAVASQGPAKKKKMGKGAKRPKKSKDAEPL